MFTERDLHLMSIWRRGGYGRISGGMRASELAAGCHEASLENGAWWMTTSLVDVEPLVGASRDAKQAGGES
jgi:hypothetical protein